MRIQTLLVVVLCLGIALPASSAEQPFKDVPKDHWGAEYVTQVATRGIMNGYPDSTFKGDKAVTRYELAVALERMIEVVEKGLKPEVKGAESQKAPQQPQSNKPDPAQRLKESGYIASDSPLLTAKNKPVTTAELAQALSSVADKLIKKHIPPPED